MKARHAGVLENFEASSVILFAALVAGDFRLANQAPCAPASRGAAMLARPASRPTPTGAMPKKPARAAPAVGAQRAPGPQPSAVSAVARAIERMESGEIRGFVPFEPPV